MPTAPTARRSKTAKVPAKAAEKRTVAKTTAAKKKPDASPEPRPSASLTRGFVVERSIELEVEIGKVDACDVRIDLLRSRAEPTTFRARLWRLELYRIQSTFPQGTDGEPRDPPSDELIMKEWESVPEPFDAFTAGDLDAAEAHVLERLDAWLTTVRGHAR